MPGAYSTAYSWSFDTGCAWYPWCNPCEQRGNVYIGGDYSARTNVVEKIGDDGTQGALIWGTGDSYYDIVACNDAGEVWGASAAGLTKISSSGVPEWTHEWFEPEPPNEQVQQYVGLAVAGNTAYMGTYYGESFNRRIGITRFDSSGGFTQGPIVEPPTASSSISQIDCDDTGNVAATMWIRDTDDTLMRFSSGGTEMWRIGQRSVWGNAYAVRIDPTTGDILVGTAATSGPGYLRRVTAGGIEITDGTWPIAVTDTDRFIQSFAITNIGDIYVIFTSDAGTMMRKYSKSGAPQWTTNTSGVTRIEVNDNGEVYGASGNTVRKFMDGVFVWSYDWSVTGNVTFDVAVDPGRAGAFR